VVQREVIQEMMTWQAANKDMDMIASTMMGMYTREKITCRMKKVKEE